MQTSEIMKAIDADVKKNKVLLFMKGNKLMPMCGFSSRVLEILNKLDADFETRNILEDEELRAAIKIYADWPTFPQLYIDGEFIGGCDIVTQLFESGELAKLLKK
ncbi:MAG: Grx4 family monothiol glutaredoxin [Simkaniaceae bacterium]|nr:Grx4 family monothiol glutaredoxin [Simkaniaceae bacterium]